MSLRILLIASAAIIIPAAGVTAALAQDGPPRRGAALEELDTNQDGEISRAEADARRQAMFAEIDTNGDGALSIEEMTAHREARRAERQERRRARGFGRLDQNGDGQISADEFSGPALSRFERADLDENGVVTETELALVREQMRSRRGEGRARRRGQRQGRGS